MNIKSKKEIILLTSIILIQTIIFIILGFNKAYIHMDEAFSFGLASYDKIKIQNNEGFYNAWHNKEYYKDYLVVNEDEKNDFWQVYENQKNDVHPPLYYLFLRIAMGFNVDNFSVWPGIIVNIIIYFFITIFTYLIIKKLLQNTIHKEIKSTILTLVSTLILSSLTNVIYIRMYALSTLNIAITTYLHLKLLDTKKSDIKLLIGIGMSALVGSLTHYYYLFYLAMLGLMFVIKYLKEKEYEELRKYIITMIIAGAFSLLIFPYSINHMFFGYRGQGAISNLENVSKFFKSISKYIEKVNFYVFNNCLWIILPIIILLFTFKKLNKNKYLKYIVFPIMFYFLLVSISSPWIELRYIMPICQMLFIVTMILIIDGFSNIFKDRTSNILLVITIIILFTMPIISNKILDVTDKTNFRIKNEVLYLNKKDIVNKLENELNVPTIYLIHPKHNRFLDDILLFSKIDESYMALDFECNEENLKLVMKEKDLSNGIVVFVSDGQDKNSKLEIIKKVFNLEKITHLERMNACDIYYISE